jgi:hypothetical protein
VTDQRRSRHLIVVDEHIEALLQRASDILSDTNARMDALERRETDMPDDKNKQEEPTTEEKIMAALDGLSKRLDKIERRDAAPVMPTPAAKPPQTPPLPSPAAKDDDDQDMVAPPEGQPHPPKAIPGEAYPVAADSTRRLDLIGVQARFDAVSRLFGTQAERAMDGERVRGYRERLLTPWQKYSSEWKGVDLEALDSVTFEVAERQIMRDAQQIAKNPPVVPGRLMERRSRLDSGHLETKFYGSPKVWLNPRGSRYVTRLATPSELRARAMFGSSVSVNQ